MALGLDADRVGCDGDIRVRSGGRRRWPITSTHVCQLAGSHRHAAIGSDLDGGFGTEQSPVGMDRISDLHDLGEILARHGHADSAIDDIFHGNWLRFFRKHLPS